MRELAVAALLAGLLAIALAVWVYQVYFDAHD
jgi:hypothetical protein